MKRLLILAGAVVLAAASVSPALAAKPRISGPNTNFTFVRQYLTVASTVEQQPGVVNPTGCLWSTDDNTQWQALSATIQAGGSSATADCLIADQDLHMQGVRVGSPSPSLVVTITYQPQNVTFTLPARAVSGEYEYRGCVVGPVYGQGDPQTGIIPNSNGGWGLQTSIVISVTNPTGARVRSTQASTDFGSDASGYFRSAMCYPDFNSQTDWFSAGGAAWKSAL